VDALYRHFSNFGNYFCEAAGERAFLLVAPAFSDVALDDRHKFLRLALMYDAEIIAERGPAQQPEAEVGNIRLRPREGK
jgi:hypothetical protein